ncbi:MAG: hypothetical protein J0H71_21035 [Rhizobiales bacterium]|nr:hypothetical protein [Hyphomicrobiales bacterium]
MTPASKKSFGKRPPPVDEAARPAKRSGYVALFLMGTVAVGAGAYAMMPSEKCEPAKPPAAGQPVPPGAAATQNQSCRTSSRSGGYSYGRSSGSSFFDSSSSSSTHSSSSGGLAIPSKSTTARGGFGSYGHAVAASSRGG